MLCLHKFQGKNWKQMQIFFLSPSELIKKISNHEHFIQKCLLNQGFSSFHFTLIFFLFFLELIKQSRKYLEDFEEKTSNLKETKLYDEFIKVIYDFLFSFYALYDHIFSNTKLDDDKFLNTEQSTKIIEDKENSKKRLLSSDCKIASSKMNHSGQSNLIFLI